MPLAHNDYGIFAFPAADWVRADSGDTEGTNRRTPLKRTADYSILSEARTEIMGITMLAVFIHHSGIVWPTDWFIVPFKFLRDSIYITLDFLLFMSAYGLVRSRLTHPIPWPRFLYRRFVRVLPAYWLVMAALTIYEILTWQIPSLEKLFLRFSTLGFWFSKQGPLAAEWFIPALLGLYLLFPILFTWYERSQHRTRLVVAVIVASLLIGIAPILANRSNLLIWTTRIPTFMLAIHIGYRVFTKAPAARNASIPRAMLIVALCYTAVAVMLTVTTEDQRWRYGLWWPPFVPAIVPGCLLLSLAIVKMKTGSWQKVARPFIWLLTFCGTYSLEILMLHEPLYNLARIGDFLNAHVPGLSRVMHVVNTGRYFEYAVYAAVTLALVPSLHKVAEIIRKEIDALVEPATAEAGKARTRVMYVAGIVLIIGVLSGMFLQKFYGLGNILRTVGLLPRVTAVVTPVSASIPAASSIEIPPAYQGKLTLFLLAGQSNMVGMGDLKQATLKSNGKVFTFGNDYRWHVAAEPVDDPAGQVDQVSQDSWVGAGPALTFALALSERAPTQAIGLVPCAKGETTIADWQRNLSDRSLYGSCLKRARAASTMGQVAGLLFFQGETDAADPKLFPAQSLRPDQWASSFAAMVNDFREDLALPRLPVVFAQIGTTTYSSEIAPYWEIVRAQQRSVQLPATAMITTDDLALQDEVHFTTESYQLIGRRFAEAFWNLVRM